MEADQGTISEVKFSSAIGNTVSKNKTASIPEAERWKQRRRGEAEKEEVKRKWERGGEAEESEMEEAEEERK